MCRSKAAYVFALSPVRLDLDFLRFYDGAEFLLELLLPLSFPLPG